MRQCHPALMSSRVPETWIGHLCLLACVGFRFLICVKFQTCFKDLLSKSAMLHKYMLCTVSHSY